MKRFRFVLMLALLALVSADAVRNPEECLRPVPDDLYEYKESYLPTEFHHEPFSMEVVDLAVVAGAMMLAAWFSVKKKPSRRISWLIFFTLLYIGFFRGGCICPVGATTNFCIGLAAPELIGKTAAILFLLPLMAAFFVGRVFCSSACPLGAVQHLLARKKGLLLSNRFNSVMRLLPIAMLVATAWGALRGGLFIACKLDVYKMLFFTGYAWIDQLLLWIKGALTESRILLIGDWVAWSSLALALLLGIFVPRPFCRFLCPYGVLLGVTSKLGLRRRHIDETNCINCVACAVSCPVQAISLNPDERRVQVSDFHCIQCGRCDDACATGSIRSFKLGSQRQ